MIEKERRIQQRQQEYDDLPKKPLQIDFDMATPFSSIHLQHIDSILAYHSLLQLFPEDFYDMHETRPPLESPLPLEKRSNNAGQWWWAASAAKYILELESIATWKKRWDEEHDYLVEEPDKRLFRIDHKAGHYKAYNMPILLRSAKVLSFCCVGNLEEIERLLSKVTHMGKKRSQGWGRIRKIAITDSDYDWSCWDREGKPMRAIPMNSQEILEITNKTGGVHLANVAYRAPYWWPGNKALCVIP